jgi:hypothetical protein
MTVNSLSPSKIGVTVLADIASPATQRLIVKSTDKLHPKPKSMYKAHRHTPAAFSHISFNFDPREFAQLILLDFNNRSQHVMSVRASRTEQYI